MAGTSSGADFTLSASSNAHLAAEFTASSDQLHIRFYVDRDNEIQGNSEEHRCLFKFGANDQGGLMFGTTSGGSKYGRLFIKNDGRTSTSWGAQTTWDSGAQYIEIVIYKATGPAAGDAYAEWYSDGVLKERSPAAGGIDLYDDWPDEFQFGGWYQDTNTSGNIYFDQVKIADDLSMIGPHIAGGAGRAGGAARAGGGTRAGGSGRAGSGAR